MKKVKITVMKKVCHEDLIALYEKPIENPCSVEEGGSVRKIFVKVHGKIYRLMSLHFRTARKIFLKAG